MCTAQRPSCTQCPNTHAKVLLGNYKAVFNFIFLIRRTNSYESGTVPVSVGALLFAGEEAGGQTLTKKNFKYLTITPGELSLVGLIFIRSLRGKDWCMDNLTMLPKHSKLQIIRLLKWLWYRADEALYLWMYFNLFYTSLMYYTLDEWVFLLFIFLFFQPTRTIFFSSSYIPKGKKHGDHLINKEVKAH